MGDSNQKIHLGDVAEIIMGQSPKGETYNTSGEGIPLLNGPTEFGASHPIPALWTTSLTRLCNKGDILFCVRGSTTGRMNWADQEYCIGRGIGAFRAKTDVTDTRFLWYNLIYELHRLLSLSTGSVFPNLARQDFETFPIDWPNKTIRSAIASILGALDDKIELNRKMNETLEAMARTIFKSWFVDFDPIPGLSPHKEWQDSPLGKIPKGWRVEKVSEAFEINPSRPIKRDVSYAYVDMASLPTTSARVTNIVHREFTGSGSKFQNGDMLFARITPCLENGKTALVDFLTEGEYGWGSTEFIVFSPKEPLNPWFVYCVARDKEFREHAIRAMSGTSGRQRVEIGCFNNFLKVIPHAEIVDKFGNIVSRWFHQMKMNDEESATLTSIRNTLLPKLLSGEIRVKDN